MIIYLFKECHCKYKGLNFIIGMDGKKGKVFRGISDVVHSTSMLCHMQRQRCSIRQNINSKLL